MSNSISGLSTDTILRYAASPHGMDASMCNRTTRARAERLVSEGYLVRVIAEVHLPEVKVPESCKKVAMFDTWSARVIESDRYRLVRYPNQEV